MEKKDPLLYVQPFLENELKEIEKRVDERLTIIEEKVNNSPFASINNGKN